MAHLLTAIRLVLAAPTAAALARPDFVAAPVLAAFLVVAIATDFLDGIVARRLGTASPRGMLFDHTTDFLFVTAGLAGASLAGSVPAILPVLIVIAFAQYVLDSHYLHHRKELRMSTLGRWNGILYFVPLVVIALSRLSPLDFLAGLLGSLAWWTGWLLAASTVGSIIDRALAPSAQPGLPGSEPG